MEVREDLDNVLYHEEILWRQKARCDWLVLGDRNTKFFHTRTLRRRKQNLITALKNELRDWIMDEEQLKTEAVNFFKALYGEHPGPMTSLPTSAFPPLTDEDFRFLNNPVYDEEIEVVLFDMALLKALGSDDFHSLFYQSQWDHVGASICSWVKSIFAGKSINAELNNLLIVLLPKIQNPECFAQFRPISLCSVLYKLVMKIIANRFKVVFPKLIALEQTGFIAGRNITDNIVMAQEVVHSMKSMQKNRKWMGNKIDLEKAYDRVRWDFIGSSLQAAGIPIFLRNVIMSTISTSTMQVLWNGIPTSKFRPTRGVRQGCPLSPYLFILCMEWLSYNIHAAIGAGIWTLIRLARNSPPLFHLFFADKLILFGHAEEHQVCSKLSSWDARQLSWADRVTVAQSVLLSILSYFMQTMMVPKGLCDEIECIVRKFVWGSSKGNSKVRFDDGFAAAGGFVFDHNDGWIMGYCRYLGNYTVVEAELWGILDGLNLILNRSFEKVVIQTDSIEVVNAIQEGYSRTSNFALVRRILIILKALNQWRIQHIPREENLIADSLAKSVHSKRLGLRLIEDPPL
ncbi:hypothetical protein PVK06_033269 [Gossypium arboreum]|uniref:Reverse transcriptase domain-containing protein n=1 Tax=Gossypium arboreum TaxID=29729 RepID=A0ABR0NAX9_GOSAR|nr:hypothetical protein PVK06_033269 [Gossypium arboreum]